MRITEEIAASERRHTGETRFAVEGALPWSYLWKSLPARSRALMVFSKLRVWDTEANNGVLIYVLLADRSVDIVADRGIAGVKGSARCWPNTSLPMRNATTPMSCPTRLPCFDQSPTGLCRV